MEDLHLQRHQTARGVMERRSAKTLRPAPYSMPRSVRGRKPGTLIATEPARGWLRQRSLRPLAPAIHLRISDRRLVPSFAEVRYVLS